ncbi:MAG: hypothetical protein BWZ00_01514 [Bacteroidetes bacterium ADurb.BinA174]|nr:MAG: hypothetical protein BWZ00_01514 [Bacteroidetes bacterium ADurb.BinA174]
MKHNFKKLDIWNRSVDFVTEIYQLTQMYPKEEIFGLIAQTRRAAVSAPLNISEGSAKSSNKDFARFLEMAIGSLFEVETALVIACKLNYINSDELLDKQTKVNELQRMINGFKDTLEK